MTSEQPSAENRPGRPMPCLVTGGVMLAVPVLSGLAAVPEEPVGGRLVLGAPLAVGVLAVVLATARPRGSPMPVLALVCAAAALLAQPALPRSAGSLAAGLCGLAGLAFLLTVRLHRQALDGPVDVAEWLAAHRPMVVGASVTAPAAIAAGALPFPWSVVIGALLATSVAVAALATAAFR
ncbi:MAG: hypothetical protein J2P19_27690 [Pseudonocardia sp.]|nr:hypothetical protein [Pseudonocardia sp.]